MVLQGKNSKSNVLEIANRATVQKLSTESLSGLTLRLDNHESGLNTNAHQIVNISGLQSTLDTKADKSIVTASITVVTDVDFINSTVTTSTINIQNGIIVSIT